MKDKNTRIDVELLDKHARIRFSIDGYLPNSYSAFTEIDNSDILDGSFGYHLYESDEWGVGEFNIQKESIHSMVRQLRAFIHSDQSEIHIVDEEVKIDLYRKKEQFVLILSMNDQFAGDFISVKKTLSYRDLYKSLLKPLDAISKTCP